MLTMYRFQTSVHALPTLCGPGPTIERAGRQIATLAVAGADLSGASFDCSFEEAVARLGELERLFVEPDGSFVWVSDRKDRPWQVDGMVYDRNERVQFVELKGGCPADAFDRLLAAFGWPRQAVIFHVAPAAVLMGEEEFRRCATADAI
jgi:hypothetical protein